MLNKSPKIYGIAYFAFIPTFAILYYLLPICSFNSDLSMDSFLTCCYFSTVTITTLGYGDISAQSEIAQLLSMLETVIGVITIGLFLNSLSVRKSIELSNFEKSKLRDEQEKQESKKILRYNLLIEQNFQFYEKYVYEVTTPFEKRNSANGKIDLRFTIHDFKDIYYGSFFNLTDDSLEPLIVYYFRHQKYLIESIKDLILNVDFNHWTSLQQECVEFIKINKQYDYSPSILCRINQISGHEPAINSTIKMLIDYKGDMEISNNSTFDSFIALRKSILYNIKFMDNFRKKTREIELFSLLPLASDKQ